MSIFDSYNQRRIEELVEEADRKLREAERIANTYHIPFRYQLAADIGEAALGWDD